MTEEFCVDSVRKILNALCEQTEKDYAVAVVKGGGRRDLAARYRTLKEVLMLVNAADDGLGMEPTSVRGREYRVPGPVAGEMRRLAVMDAWCGQALTAAETAENLISSVIAPRPERRGHG